MPTINAYSVISNDSTESYQTHQETLHQSTPHPPCRCKQWRPSSLVVSVQLFLLVLYVEWSELCHTLVYDPSRLTERRDIVRTSYMFGASALTAQTDSMHHTAWTGSLLENEEAHRISLPVPGRAREVNFEPIWFPGSGSFKPSGVCSSGIGGGRNLDDSKEKAELLCGLQHPLSGH